LCEGETLADRLARAPLRPATVADLGTQIAAGLARAHAAGIAHGRLHAGNILLAADGQTKILDFGLAALRKVVLRAQSAQFSGAEELRQALRALRSSGTRPTVVPFTDQPTVREI